MGGKCAFFGQAMPEQSKVHTRPRGAFYFLNVYGVTVPYLALFLSINSQGFCTPLNL